MRPGWAVPGKEKVLAAGVGQGYKGARSVGVDDRKSIEGRHWVVDERFSPTGFYVSCPADKFTEIVQPGTAGHDT
jgi:hypothetical protein